MDVSVIIPTRGRVKHLAACLQALGEQDFDANRFEVLVGVDGDDAGEVAVFAELAERSKARMRGSVQTFAHAGPAATRNRLIEHARGRLLLMLNDDVVPDPALVRLHVDAHQDLGRPVMILGAAPWAVGQPDRLFDRLIRETSMVFFYDQMAEGAQEPDRDWGFRHAWTLNLSVPADAVREIGGFCEAMQRPVYEDLELGWKLSRRCGMPLLYRPQARVTHVHRYEPLEFLHRDAVLGHQAWRLAEVSPQCAIDMFGADMRSEREVAYSREFLDRQRRTAMRHVSMFLGLADIPADAIQGPHSSAIIRMIYEQGLLLRRYMWRLGHLAAAESRPVADAVAWLEEQITQHMPYDGNHDRHSAASPGHHGAAEGRDAGSAHACGATAAAAGAAEGLDRAVAVRRVPRPAPVRPPHA